jgi:protein-S-isoprenylcysteine O-methyltransferase Ste14
MILGYHFFHLSGGSWARECLGLSFGGTIAKTLAFLWIVDQIFVVFVFVDRMKKEDGMLRKEFSDWDKWASKVPYKAIPYVY